jgi:hypothetical protein
MRSVLRVLARHVRVAGVAAVVVACGMLPGSAQAQTPGSAVAAPVASVAPRPADVASADAIIAALYGVISGPAGEKRDWNRFRSLFIPDARLIIARGRRDSTSGRVLPRVLTTESYIQGAGALEEKGFFEREISQVSETFGGVTHRFSTYESRARAEDPQPFARGINSIQLLNDGTRWWVVTIFWDVERPNNPIPERYLPKG